ncbi:MAG: cyclic pyranopterin monophosphate synthase MoaC [Verrucomicrobiota bacterium]
MDFTHLDDSRKPRMVDVSGKKPTERIATAECYVHLGLELIDRLNKNDWSSSKGPIFETAIIAGTLAAKKTADLIPFCHPLPLKDVKIDISQSDESKIRISARVKVLDQTGVEMEALTAVSVAALTIYDMCKSISHSISIESCRLVSKSGGKSDFRE